jgi:hypothetical protein
LLETFLAILVVELSLLRIGEDFVGFGDLLEFLGRIWVVCILVLKTVRFRSLMSGDLETNQDDVSERLSCTQS